VLFKEGDTDRRTFVLLDGRVEIVKDGEQVAEIGVSESFIGEISALTGKPRWATARTVDPSTLLVVEDVRELFKAGGTWGVKLAQVLAERLDRTNERFQRLQALLEETRGRDSDITLIETLRIAVRGEPRVG
jgi:CRP-like cAMP-binding protein